MLGLTGHRQLHGTRWEASRELGKLSHITARPLVTVEVPDDWNKANITAILKKGKKEDLGS